jgi:hypothetical protein
MRKPHALGAGPKNAGLKSGKSLAGDKLISTATGPFAQRNSLAFRLDRLADFHLHLGHHLQAERLAHRAAMLREVAP